MNRRRTNWPLVIAGGVLVGLFLVACLSLVWLGMGTFLTSRSIRLAEYRSNGAQIYFTATS